MISDLAKLFLTLPYNVRNTSAKQRTTLRTGHTRGAARSMPAIREKVLMEKFTRLFTYSHALIQYRNDVYFGGKDGYFRSFCRNSLRQVCGSIHFQKKVLLGIMSPGDE